MSFKFTLSQFLADEIRGEVLEYALVSGLIVAAAISRWESRKQSAARWNSLNSSL